MIQIKVIHYSTGESYEKTLSPDGLIQGGGLIGRNPKCDLVLNSPEVSRVHGRILYQNGQYYFADLGSTDGSQVNDQVAPTNQIFHLKPDDVIRIGGFLLLIEKINLQIHALTQYSNELNGKADSVQIKPLILKSEDVKSRIVHGLNQAELIFQGKYLTEGESLSKRFYQKAIEICQTELSAGRFCLLVEYPDHLTLWQEQVVQQSEDYGNG